MLKTRVANPRYNKTRVANPRYKKRRAAGCKADDVLYNLMTTNAFLICVGKNQTTGRVYGRRCLHSDMAMKCSKEIE